MNNKIINTELQALTQKSFYGKAKIYFKGSWIYLQSYETIVCSFNMNTKEFRRHWSSWSVTTSKHVNDFLVNEGFERGLTKKEWQSLPVTSQDLY